MSSTLSDGKSKAKSNQRMDNVQCWQGHYGKNCPSKGKGKNSKGKGDGKQKARARMAKWDRLMLLSRRKSLSFLIWTYVLWTIKGAEFSQVRMAMSMWRWRQIRIRVDVDEERIEFVAEVDTEEAKIGLAMESMGSTRLDLYREPSHPPPDHQLLARSFQ